MGHYFCGWKVLQLGNARKGDDALHRSCRSGLQFPITSAAGLRRDSLTPAATFFLDHKKRAVPLLRHLALHQSAEALEYRRADCPGCAMDANPANRQNRHFPGWLSRLGFTAPAGEGDDNSCGKPHCSSLGRGKRSTITGSGGIILDLGTTVGSCAQQTG